jgi:hypothetical protein
MLLILKCLAIALLGAKLLWNIVAAFTLAKRRRASDQSGISLMPSIEVVLLGLAVVLEWVAQPADRLTTPLLMGALGLGAIVVSYLAMFIVGALYFYSTSKAENQK